MADDDVRSPGIRMPAAAERGTAEDHEEVLRYDARLDAWCVGRGRLESRGHRHVGDQAGERLNALEVEIVRVRRRSEAIPVVPRSVAFARVYANELTGARGIERLKEQR